ncbi:MAG: hypothetical protein ACQSGP_24595 [Frankia sp.]
MDPRFLIALILSPSVLAGMVAIIKRHQWLGFVRHVYDAEMARGHSIDAIRLLEVAGDKDAARLLVARHNEQTRSQSATTDRTGYDSALSRLKES